ncbi:MAG: hypothetical protein LBR58_04530 [Propionibacteriaceae bacterium]|jgi:hypothetical protein|nr:hypothetical protein [Propionibacteriaceae bacterium]
MAESTLVQAQPTLARWTPETLLVAAFWLYLTLPSMVGCLAYGSRVDPSLSGSHLPVSGPLVAIFEWLTLGLLLAACLLAILRPAGTRQRVNPGAWVAVGTPVFAVVVATIQGRGAPLSQAVILVLAVACVFLNPTRQLLRAVGVSVVTTAAVSLLMGFQGSGMVSGWNSETKPILFGNVLAGPFPFGNSLGMALALGVPLVLVLRRRWLRWTGLAAVALAITWSASRTAMIAAAAGLLAYALARRVPMSWKTMTFWCGAVFAAAATVPFLGWSPETFSNRGSIWRRSVQALQDFWFLGMPAGASPVPGEVGHGQWSLVPHSTFLAAVADGGIVQALLVVVLFLCSVAAFTRTDYPAVGFAVGMAMAVNSTTENILPFPPAMKTGTVVLLLLIMAASWHPHPHRQPEDAT